MKKVFFFAATVLAAATMSLNAQVWHAVPDDAAVEVRDGDYITTQGAVIAAKGDPVQVGADVFGDKVQVSLQDGGADWVARGNREDGTFTGLDGVTYNKVYAQGGTNGMKGGIEKSGTVSAHIEIVPAVAGTVHIAAKYGYKKSIWAAKVPEAEVEDLVYTEMYKYAIDGFSTLTPGADTTLMYIKADGSGMMVGQDPAATADVFTTLALEVEPGYTYFFWVEGSKIMLCGINFVAGEAPSAPQMQLHGSWVENWGGPKMDIAADNATASATITWLSAGNYEFGIKELDEAGAQVAWWSPTAGDTFTREANSVVLVKDGSKNAKLTADVAGDYKFVYSYATHTLTIEYPELPEYTLLVGVDNACKDMGTVSGSGMYHQGDMVTIYATPYSDYHFVKWSDGNKEATRVIKLTSDTTLYATFDIGRYQCGIDLYWNYKDNVLRLFGSGAMDITNYAENTWAQYINEIYAISLPEQLTTICDYAFTNAKHLAAITIPAEVVSIGESAFEDCRSMDSVVFAGNKVESIGDWAFYNCHNLSRINIPEGVEEIGTAAFYGCTFLSELTLPSTTKKIAQNGFALCSKLQTMYVNALVPPTIEAKTFEDVDRATPVFVPQGTLELYQADQYWSEFFNMAEYEAPMGNLTPSANETNALRKVLRDGHVLIIRGEKTYDIMGQKVE